MEPEPHRHTRGGSQAGTDPPLERPRQGQSNTPGPRVRGGPTLFKPGGDLNAAEVWGCNWVEILDAQVWAAQGEQAAPMPTLHK